MQVKLRHDVAEGGDIQLFDRPLSQNAQGVHGPSGDAHLLHQQREIGDRQILELPQAVSPGDEDDPWKARIQLQPSVAQLKPGEWCGTRRDARVQREGVGRHMLLNSTQQRYQRSGDGMMDKYQKRFQDKPKNDRAYIDPAQVWHSSLNGSEHRLCQSIQKLHNPINRSIPHIQNIESD